MSIRDGIIEAHRLSLQQVKIDGIAGDVFIAPMSAYDIGTSGFNDIAGVDDPTLAQTVAAMCGVCAVAVRESDGEPAFRGRDDTALRRLPMDTLTALFNACLAASGLDDVEFDAKALEGHGSDPTEVGSATSEPSHSPQGGRMYSPSPAKSPPATTSSGRRTPRSSVPSARTTPTTSTD